MSLVGCQNYEGGTYMGTLGFIFSILAAIGLFIPGIGRLWLVPPGAVLAILLCGFASAKAIREKQPIDGSVVAGLAPGVALL